MKWTSICSKHDKITDITNAWIYITRTMYKNYKNSECEWCEELLWAIEELENMLDDIASVVADAKKDWESMESAIVKRNDKIWELELLINQ
jgi:hypothetical protein